MLRKISSLLLLLILTGCSSGHRVSDDEIALAEFQKNFKRTPTVVIDAGHGGDDFGTHSDKPPIYQEKRLALSTARMLSIYLKQLGFRTKLIRSEDVFIPLKERAAIANDLRPKVFVSVHYNSAPNKKASGIEVYFYDSDKDLVRAEKSKALASSVLDRVLEHTEAKSRGVKHGNFAVIRETKMPAILVEGGFLTNDAERKKIQNPAYLKKLALGIAEGIQSYLR